MLYLLANHPRRQLVTDFYPASEDLALPSYAYSEAPWGMEHPGHMPKLGFLSHLEDVSADLDTAPTRLWSSSWISTASESARNLTVFYSLSHWKHHPSK
jgi:hypothetical protein